MFRQPWSCMLPCRCRYSVYYLSPCCLTDTLCLCVGTRPQVVHDLRPRPRAVDLASSAPLVIAAIVLFVDMNCMIRVLCVVVVLQSLGNAAGQADPDYCDWNGEDTRTTNVRPTIYCRSILDKPCVVRDALAMRMPVRAVRREQAYELSCGLFCRALVWGLPCPRRGTSSGKFQTQIILNHALLTSRCLRSLRPKALKVALRSDDPGEPATES